MKYLQLTIFLIIITSIIGLGHVGIYYALKSSFILSLRQEQSLVRVLAGLAVSFIVMTLIINSVYSWLGSRLYTASAVRLGTVYRLFMASIVILLFVGINRLIGGIIPIAMIGKVLIIIALGVSIYGLRNSNQTKTVHYTVAINNLPASREGKKIALITDTHVGAVRNVGLLHRIRPLIEAESPEMLLVAGDFRDGPKANDKDLAQALAAIKTTHGTYFAPGNHEEYGGLEGYLITLQQAGIHVLNNQITTISGLQMIGVDYSSTTTATGFAAILSGLNIDASQPSILIKHVPSHPEIVNEFGISLQVAGHVHQGQVWPGPLLARRVFGAFAYGLNQIGQSRIITSSGVGTRGPPQRISTRSEIVIITLIKK